MQLLTIVTLLAGTALATPASPASPNLASRQNCGVILPACNGGRVVAQTFCRCPGQVERCDLWTCPQAGGDRPMVCGQQGTGCVWI